eukprot:1152332-Pelagomonas_calceolata.AAC.7
MRKNLAKKACDGIVATLVYIHTTAGNPPEHHGVLSRTCPVGYCKCLCHPSHQGTASSDFNLLLREKSCKFCTKGKCNWKHWIQPLWIKACNGNHHHDASAMSACVHDTYSLTYSSTWPCVLRQENTEV